MTNNDNPVDNPVQVRPVTCADIAALRAQRLSIHTESDLAGFNAEADRISGELDAHAAQSHLPIGVAIALAVIVVVLAAIIAFLLFGAGAALLGSLSDGS